jgi:hypothetical protein
MSLFRPLRFSRIASRKLRLWLAVPLAAAGLALSTCETEAQVVRPSIGRLHTSWGEPHNAASLRGRYLERQATPRFQERQTHLGWEVRGETYVVVANSSLADARQAAAAIEATWHDTLRMADYWTERHQSPNFSVAAISVHIDENPRRDRQEGDLRFVNDRTHIYLNVAAGQPTFDQQLGNLRASTVHAFWRRGEFDRQLPTWVRSGLASYVANQQALAVGDTAQPAPGTNHNVYDAYWQRERVGRHQLAPAPPAEADAALRVLYLLEGDDARHAPTFFTSLARTLQQAPPQEQLDRTRAFRTNDQYGYETNVDRYFAQVEDAMGAWVSNPLVDQPMIIPLDEQPNVTRRQQEMAFVLKIAQRKGEFGSSGIRPKIVGGENAGVQSSARSPLSIEQLWRDVASTDTPLWATLDPQGNLLLSNQTDRLRELMEPHGGVYRSVMREGHWALETRVDRTTKLVAWLEENPDSPRQPLVKFERIVDQGVSDRTFGQ